MQRLGQIVPAEGGSLPSRRESETRNLPSPTMDNLPAEHRQEVDQLFRLVTWRGADGSIEIARPLRDEERKLLVGRAQELASCLEPFEMDRPGDMDRVAEAVGDMLGGFPSMRQEGVDAVARIDSMARSLARHLFPVWAIEQACRAIQDAGYERSDGKRTWTERTWPPSDSEVATVARLAAFRRSAQRANALALLGAKVAT